MQGTSNNSTSVADSDEVVRSRGSIPENATTISSSSTEEIEEYPDEADDEDGKTKGLPGLLRTVTEVTDGDVMGGVGLTRKMTSREEQRELEPKRAGFWSKNNTVCRKMFFKQYPIIVLLLCTYFFAVFSIYWGSLYRRTTRLHNLTVAVAVESDRTGIVTESLLTTLNSTAIKSLLGWRVLDFEDESSLINAVHRQNHWATIYVASNNISTELTSAFTNGTALPTELVKCYYETGRDPSGMSSYVKPTLYAVDVAYMKVIGAAISSGILKGLSETQLVTAVKNDLLASVPSIALTDARPMTDPTVMAPLQVGLIYIVILSLFQILWFLKLNGDIAKHLRPVNYIIYRMVLPQITYLLLSLAYTCVNRAFNVNLQATWKGGFAIFWMVSYLVFGAVGGATENVVLILTATFPPLMGFWMLFFIVINISATFSPVELCPRVFRYTYAMAIKNGYELNKIVFFNTYKGKIGTYIAVLVVWIIVNNLLMPLCLMFFSNTMKKKMVKEAKQTKLAQHEAAAHPPQEKVAAEP